MRRWDKRPWWLFRTCQCYLHVPYGLFLNEACPRHGRQWR